MTKNTDKQESITRQRERWHDSWAKADGSAKKTLEQEIETTELSWSEEQISKGNTPMISVVMSVYNTEKYVAEALESILHQTFRDFEIILIDDGSSDSSIDIVRGYKDPRIRIIHQTNHGLVYSFNKGIKLARGQFIARMDADDICLPSRFEKELAWLLAKPDRGLVGTYFRYIDQDTKKPLEVIQTSPTKHIDIARMMYIVNPFGHGSIMMKREAVMEAGLYRSEYEPSEDYDLWRRIALKWEVGQIPEILYLWRFQTTGLGNISQRKREQSNASAARTVGNMWDGPIYSKNIREIVKDAKDLLRHHGTLGNHLYNQYLEHQLQLSLGFMKRGKIRTGMKSAIAVTWLAPKTSYHRIWKVAPKAAIKNRRNKS